MLAMAMERGQDELADQELARPAAILAQRFVQRWDAYPQQLDDGRYICVHEPLNVSHLYAHLRGGTTLGTYLLNRESKVRFVVLDNDSETGWKYLLTCGSKLANANIPAYLEKSRRGGHLWMFFEKPIDGSEARSFSQALAKKYRFEGFEIYPKQDTIGKGFGSLIRLPFGMHRLTGKRYGFYGIDGEPLGSTLREQLFVLQRPQVVSEALLKSYKMISSPEKLKALPKRSSETTRHLSERLKSRVTALEFISQYVDLKPTESGAIGLCPFHDDQHPSFGVSNAGNYWHCFAGCGGGSIIDFWSLWRKKNGLDPDFIPTITELAEMLF
jgi:hypothetical protein